MDVFKINPYIRAAKNSIIPPGGDIHQRIIFDYELIYIEDGAFILNYDGIDYPCKTGDFLLLRPGICHSFNRIVRDLSQPHIHFDVVFSEDSPSVPISFKDLPDLKEQEKLQIRRDIFAAYPKVPRIRFRDTEAALILFRAITGDPSLSPLVRKGKFLQLLDMLITENFPVLLEKSASQYPVENEIKDYIDAGQGLTLSLEDLARQFMYSKFYIERRFKAAFGISLMAYRNEKRLQKARLLLQRESVTAVAEQLGFSSVYAFSRAFRHHFGFPPSKVKETSGRKS